MGLSGHLHLTCSADPAGRSYLREQSFRVPMHLSKPHEDAGVLVVNVVNPTAGLLAGDRIDVRIRVESGARLLVTTPSASRAHAMPQGRAELVQEFEVESGGWLENWPELFIPQGGTRYRQRTALRVAEGGEALFFETLAPGRVAMGEAFAFTELEWETDVSLGGEPIARERYRLALESAAVAALRAQFSTAYYASCFAITPRLGPDSPCWAAIHALHEPEAWVGCSPLRRGGHVVKVVAAGSVLLRRKLAAIRRELHAALGRPAPSLRRATGWEESAEPARIA
jgi:urease accessory protein